MGMKPFERLGRLIRETSKKLGSPPARVENARARALRGWNVQEKPSATRRFGIAASALISGAIAIATFVFHQHSAITYVVGSGDTPGAVGAWIAAAEGTELHFSEGTRLTLLRETRARVARADEGGARVVLERGSLKANVVHASPKTSWNVGAGPFEIHVVGTAFDVTWDPSRETFVLVMHEGRVLVQGPFLGEGRTLERGEELRVDIVEHRSATRQTSNETPVEQPSVEDPSLATEKEPVDAKNEPAAKPSAAMAIPIWRQLASQGKHDEAMQALEREGLDHVLANASVDVLLEIANEARFAKQYDRAEAILLQARGKGAGGLSAFLLGKIAMDHRHAHRDAITWFKTYLTEVPSGGLAELALARLLELQQTTNDAAEAQQTAEQYLSRFPNGSHAALARTLVKP